MEVVYAPKYELQSLHVQTCPTSPNTIYLSCMIYRLLLLDFYFKKNPKT